MIRRLKFDEIRDSRRRLRLHRQCRVDCALSSASAKAWTQLLSEGVIAAVLHATEFVTRIPLLGAVDRSSSRSCRYRLQAECNAESRLETAPWNILRWMQAPDDIVMPDGLAIGSGMTTAVDELGRWVVLFDSPWAQRYFEQRNPDVLLLELPD